MNIGRFSVQIGLVAVLALAWGCGRPALPGERFAGKEVDTSIAPKADTPLPDKPYFELGPESAKVRILAFFPIDKRHEELMNLLKGFVSQYPGKVYLKYIDPRTQEGTMLMSRHQMSSAGLLINGVGEMMIGSGPKAKHVEFNQDIGRYWTAGDLRTAVAQTVAEVYSSSPKATP